MDKDIIFDKLRNAGCRMTKIRKSIIGILSEAEEPMISSDILSELAAAGMRADRTTVYRELRFLMERKIVETVKLNDRKVYYEIPFIHHHHIVCIRCNRVKAVVLDKHLEEQEKEIYRKEKFKVSSHSLEFYGVCEDCLKNKSKV
jgi:Fe2+ or Zn2+ uptake regulation protein